MLKNNEDNRLAGPEESDQVEHDDYSEGSDADSPSETYGG